MLEIFIFRLYIYRMDHEFTFHWPWVDHFLNFLRDQHKNQKICGIYGDDSPGPKFISPGMQGPGSNPWNPWIRERERDLLVILDRSVWDLCLIFPYLGQVKYVKCWVFPGFSVIRRGFQPDIQIPTINQHGPCGNLRLCTMEHVTFLDDLPIKSYQTCLFSHSQLVNYQRVSPFYPVIFPWIFHYIPS